MKSRALSAIATAVAIATLAVAANAADTYSAGASNDPRIRSARFLGEDERYYSAVTQLLTLQRSAGAEFEASPEYWAALAEFQLSFGMRDKAEVLYRSVAATAADPLVAGQARLRLAEFSYERGYLDEARASLLRTREKLPEDLELDWQDLYSRVLMAQGRYNEAVTVLEDVDGDTDQEAFMRFNLGVALINDGRVAQGRTALDRVGRHGGNSELVRSLRDRANTTLGWHFLQNQLGGSAKPVLVRVRSKGPYANRALLGVGWAELAPQGKRQTRTELAEDQKLRDLNDPFSTSSSLGVLLRRGYLDDPYERAGIRSFRRTKLAGDEESSMRRALTVWVELLDRDPQDPAVHEAWLAVPFALDRLGAHTQALQYYEQAATRLEEARKRATEAVRSVQSGRMVETIMQRDVDKENGWSWELRDLPDAPETYYLQSLIAEHRYAEALKNYRDVRMLNRSMEAWKTRIAKIDSSLVNDTRTTIEPAVLFQRAMRKAKPMQDKLDLKLDEETSLSAPGTFSAKAPTPNIERPQLKLSLVPAKFDGPYERLQSVKKRTGGLVPALTAASKEGAVRLRDMAVEELTAQKSQIEKYLVEARFALARVYDGELPDEDQDEVEIGPDGKPMKPVKLQRGEYEVDKSKPLDAQLKRGKPAPTERQNAEEEVEVK